MALTLEAEQRLNSVGLVTLYDDHKSIWMTAATETMDFIASGFPTVAQKFVVTTWLRHLSPS